MAHSFLEKLRLFEEKLIYMSAMASETEREAWQSSAEGERRDCENALGVLSTAWNQSLADLDRLRNLTRQCVDFYAQGKFREGNLAVKEIGAHIDEIRDKAKPAS